MADFLNQGERTLHSRVATSACCHGDQPIGTLFNRFVRVLVVNDVVQHHTAVGMRSRIDVFTRAQRSDDDGHLVLHAHRHVMFQPRIALVHDLVDGKRRRRAFRMRGIVGCQRLGDFD